MKTLGIKTLFLAVIMSSATGKSANAQTIRLTSPDKRILYQFEIRNRIPGYRIAYEGKWMIDFSPINLVFASDSLSQGVQWIKTDRADSVEQYTLMTGRSSSVSDPYRQMTIRIRETNFPRRSVTLQVRAFNDGIGFRYVFPSSSQPGSLSSFRSDSLFLIREETAYRLTGNPAVHALVQEGYHNSHEGSYIRKKYQDLPKDSLLDMPILFSYPDNVSVSITEAALLDYAGMYLVKNNSGLVSNLSPRFSGDGYSVIAALPHESPWRVIMISSKPGRFLETNIITDLAPPLEVSDLSWLKPGKTTFPWWNGNVTNDTLNAPGNNFVTQQYYIDFCARNGLAYHSVVEYGLHQWYEDDGVSFMPGPHSNVLKPVPGLDMKQVCDYAHSKGVGVRVWVHWKALYPKLDSAFALFQQWGLSGMMVDFMDRDDQEMVNIQTEILRKAAAHHLHIQFHGAYKPTGLSRTFPNEFTREGTLNYEADKWNPLGVTPDHDLDVAFTRLTAGSTDYHLGGFRAVTADKFRLQYTRPLVLGTRAHMLAMYVVLENANAMVCDYPDAYLNQKGFEVIQQVPVTWDETIVLRADPDQCLVIARRKDKTWWIGGINSSKSRKIDVSLEPLLKGAGRRSITIYQDDLTEPFDPNELLIKKGIVLPAINGKGDDSAILEVPMAPGGGFVIRVDGD